MNANRVSILVGMPSDTTGVSCTAPRFPPTPSPSTTTPQSRPIPGRESTMSLNNAGGFTFLVSDVQRLRRFLVLGTAGGTYYVGAKKLTLDNAVHVKAMVEGGKGKEVVDTVVELSVDGRTPKQDTIIFSLALAYVFGDSVTKSLVLSHLSAVCRIPTTLFGFLEFIKLLSGSPHPKSGRAMRRAVGEWYTAGDVVRKAFACTKFANREGWTHADVLRVFHVTPRSEEQAVLFKYLTREWNEIGREMRGLLAEVEALPVDQHASFTVGTSRVTEVAEPSALQSRPSKRVKPNPSTPRPPVDISTLTRLLRFITEVESLSRIPTVTEDTETMVVEAIRRWKLAREHLSSDLLNSRRVWEALLDDMPLTATLRNLPKMTVVGLLAPLSEATAVVARRLGDREALRKARIHPFSVLLALRTYNSGHGLKGSLRWDPVPEVSAALEEAFYLSFHAVEPTNRRILLALDVSGSMGYSNISGTPLTCHEGAAAMAMAVARTEPRCHFFAFCDRFVPLDITARDSLDSVVKKTSSLPFGGTDCSLPMRHARQKDIAVDCFVVITDNETWFGGEHPVEALRAYRTATGIQAKLVVVAMIATEFTIADPEDGGMLDVVGFDAGAVQAIGEFMRGD